MFSQNTGIMLYVDDVAVERDFGPAMGFETFEMRPHTDFYCLC